jgi:ADP-ribosyl-[dinitrogen reductase] hydrolase
MKERNIYKDILFGVAVGDALGVPVEFKSRKQINPHPVTDMTGYGTYNLPSGTFSDDSSLTFCLAEALTRPFSLQTVADNFIAWLYKNYWTPHGNVFDVGIATSQAIRRLKDGCSPDVAGGMEVSDNGNGSLMRILPLLVFIKGKPIAERFELTKQVSSITHAHARSVIACFYYLEFARQISMGVDKLTVYYNLKREITRFLHLIDMNVSEIVVFDSLLTRDIFTLPADDIHSSGYVVHTLEASIWSLLTTNNYTDAVLKAVNLGEDTDTTGAVTGGLAGLLYVYYSIQKDLMNLLARKDYITNLAYRWYAFDTAAITQ